MTKAFCHLQKTIIKQTLIITDDRPRRHFINNRYLFRLPFESRKRKYIIRINRHDRPFVVILLRHFFEILTVNVGRELGVKLLAIIALNRR